MLGVQEGLGMSHPRSNPGQGTQIHIPPLQQCLIPAPPSARHGPGLWDPAWRPHQNSWSRTGNSALISLRVRHKLVEQWCPQECHQGRAQPHVEHQGDVSWWNGTRGQRGHRGTTDFMKVIATNRGPAGHPGHQIAQTEYLFPRPPCWWKMDLNGSVLSQLSPFPASMIKSRTLGFRRRWDEGEISFPFMHPSALLPALEFYFSCT